MRAPLIAIEGLDRSGKSTQTLKLVRRLQDSNRSVKLLKFPERTTAIGKLIDQYLKDKKYKLSDESVHLLFSANRWELQDKIIDLLTNQSIVVVDRYVYSGVAYSGAKGLKFQWCLNPDLGMPKPDVTIFLKFNDMLQVTTRSGFGEERYEESEFQKKVCAQFKKFEGFSEWHNINVDNKSIEEVHDEIWNLVEPVINGINNDIQTF